MGGDATIHIRSAIPQDGGHLGLSSITIHEEAGHYPDTVVNGGDPSLVVSQPCATCGDPTTGGYDFWDYNWPTPPLHNGLHDITAVVVEYWTGGYNYTPPPPVYYPTTITVDVENLLITSTSPSNPTPILWDPATMTSVPVTANVSCCYKMSQPWTLTIYKSDQTVVKSYSGSQVIGPGSTPVPVNWDGSADSPGMYPDGQTPPMAKGVYLFQWTVGWNLGGAGTDYDFDQDKSGPLTFGKPPTSLDIIGSDANGQTVSLGQTLTDANGVAPSACIANVYQEWDLQDIGDYPTQAALGNTFTQLTTKMTSNPSIYDTLTGLGVVYLVTPTDGDAARDKGHRNRTALQHNQKAIPRSLITEGGWYPRGTQMAEAVGENWPGATAADLAGHNGTADFADPMAATLHYHLQSERGWLSPPPDQVVMRQTTFQELRAGGKQPVSVTVPYGLISGIGDVVILCGHGPPEDSPYNGKIFMLGTEPQGDNSSIDDFWLVATDATTKTAVEAAMSMQDLNQTNFGSLDELQGQKPWQSIQTNGGPVRLIVWAGCSTASDANGAGLPEASVNAGASCAVGLQTHWLISDVSKFCDALAHEKNMQLPVGPKKSIMDGVRDAVRKVKRSNESKYFGIAGALRLVLPY